jgi:outer membrane protein OmpA-like peptidoglycan-associated protein
MKRIFLGMVTAALALGLIGSAFAAPSVSGSRGLFRVIDANNHGPMSFSIGTYGTYWSKSKTYTGGTNKVTYITLEPGLSFAPIKFLEFSASVPYVYQGKSTYTPTTGPVVEDNNTGLLDAEVGLKFSWQFSPMFTAGLRGAAMVPMMSDSFKSWTTHGGTRVEAVKNNVDVGGLALFSFNFMDKAKLHINGGAMYTMDEVDTAAAAAAAAAYKKYDSPITVNFGGGLEVNAFPYVTPMLEVTSSYPFLGDSATDYGRYTLKTGSTSKVKPGPTDNLLLTGGLRFGYVFGGVHNLNLTVGADYPLGSDVRTVVNVTPYIEDTSKAQYYDYQIIGGLTYAYVPPVGPKVPPTGSIAGTVTDLDGNPVSGADVAFTGTSVAPVTSGADGKFAATGLPVGMITVSVSKDGFVTKDETPTIAKKKVVDLAVKLEKKPVPKATLAGKVSDTEGKAVANATVKAEGSTATTDVSGSYTIDVVVAQTGGTYNVDVTAAGYKDKSATVALTPGQPAAKDFTLLSTTLKMKMVINFKAGSAKIVGASADIDKAAVILKDNPNVKVEIAGYTDSRGSSKKNLKLSQARADAAMAALVAAGASAGQITSKGYGAADPVASNKTAKGRLQNRRIELHVL